MKLIAFHKILIFAAVAFCLCYGIWELYQYFLPIESLPVATPVSGEAASILAVPTTDTNALWTGIAMIAGAAAMALYLIWVFRFYASRNQTA